MKIGGLLAIFFLFFSSTVGALQPAVIGGVRDGLALGLMAENNLRQNIKIRFGAEGSTGGSSLILFCDGKFPLTRIFDRYPLAFGLGLVGYFGRESNVGVPVSLIFDRPFDLNDFFFEAGLDIVGSGKLRLQAGYKF